MLANHHNKTAAAVGRRCEIPPPLDYGRLLAGAAGASASAATAAAAFSAAIAVAVAVAVTIPVAITIPATATLSVCGVGQDGTLIEIDG